MAKRERTSEVGSVLATDHRQRAHSTVPRVSRGVAVRGIPGGTQRSDRLARSPLDQRFATRQVIPHAEDNADNAVAPQVAAAHPVSEERPGTGRSRTRTPAADERTDAPKTQTGMHDGNGRPPGSSSLGSAELPDERPRDGDNEQPKNNSEAERADAGRSFPLSPTAVIRRLAQGAELVDETIDKVTAPVRRTASYLLTPGWDREFDGQFDRPQTHRLAGEKVRVRSVIPDEVTIPQAVVFAHGFTQFEKGGRKIQQRLHELGIPSFSFEPGPHSIDRYAAIAAELMEHAAEVTDHDTVTLLTISMGGVYGSRATRLNPERVGSILHSEPGGFNRQNPIILSANTVVGGLREMGAVLLDRRYKDTGVMASGLVSSARHVLRWPISSAKQIHAIATQYSNAIDEAIYMRAVHGVHAGLVLMGDDRTFQQGSMLSEIEAANAKLRADDTLPFDEVFHVVKVVPGTHFTLSTREESAHPIAETAVELFTLQQQKNAA
ncbi:MAG TPA: hypothetical protein VND99_00355 [Candidatus Acidoferrales bacterium]|nr:hypothetical protein [Candidatus Acidoferrales bacterium]